MSKNIPHSSKKGRVKERKIDKKMQKYERNLAIFFLILALIFAIIYFANKGFAKTIKDPAGCFQLEVDDNTENCLYCCKEFKVTYTKDTGCLLISNQLSVNQNPFNFKFTGDNIKNYDVFKYVDVPYTNYNSVSTCTKGADFGNGTVENICSFTQIPYLTSQKEYIKSDNLFTLNEKQPLQFKVCTNVKTDKLVYGELNFSLNVLGKLYSLTIDPAWWNTTFETRKVLEYNNVPYTSNSSQFFLIVNSTYFTLSDFTINLSDIRITDGSTQLASFTDGWNTTKGVYVWFNGSQFDSKTIYEIYYKNKTMVNDVSNCRNTFGWCDTADKMANGNPPSSYGLPITTAGWTLFSGAGGGVASYNFTTLAWEGNFSINLTQRCSADNSRWLYSFYPNNFTKTNFWFWDDGNYTGTNTNEFFISLYQSVGATAPRYFTFINTRGDYNITINGDDANPIKLKSATSGWHNVDVETLYNRTTRVSIDGQFLFNYTPAQANYTQSILINSGGLNSGVYCANTLIDSLKMGNSSFMRLPTIAQNENITVIEDGISPTNVKYGNTVTLFTLINATNSLSYVNFTVKSPNGTYVKSSYNGTLISRNSNTTNWTTSFVIGGGSSSIGNWEWNYTIMDILNTTYNQSTQTFSVIGSSLVECSGSNATHNLLYNFTLKNETSLGKYFGNINAYFNVSGADGQPFDQLMFNKTNVNNFSLCVLKNSTYYISAFINYLGTGFSNRWYFLTQDYFDANGTVRDISLYSLSTELGNSIIFQVIDETGNTVPDSYIYVKRYYPEENLYRLVAMGKTNEQGQDSIFLRMSDVWYQIEIWRDLQLKFISAQTKIITGTDPLNPLIFSISNIGSLTEYAGRYSKYYGNIIFNNATRTFTGMFTDPTGATKQTCLIVTKLDDNSQICNNCVNSASGTLTCNIGTALGTYSAILVGQGSPPLEFASKMYQDITTILSNIGKEGLFYAWIILIILMFVSTPIPVASLLLGLVAFLFSVGIGIIPATLTGIFIGIYGIAIWRTSAV